MGNSRRLVGISCLLACCIYIVPEVTFAARKIPVSRPASAADTFVKGGETLDINRHWGEVIDVKPRSINLPVKNVRSYKFPRIKDIIKGSLKGGPAKILATAAGAYLLAQLPDADWDGFQLTRTKDNVNVDTLELFWCNQPNASSCYSPDPNENGTNSSNFKRPNLAAWKARAEYIYGAVNGNRTNYYGIVDVQLATETTAKYYYTIMRKDGSTFQSKTGPFTLYRYGSCVAGTKYDGTSGACYQQGGKMPFADADYDQMAGNFTGWNQSQLDAGMQHLVQEYPASFDGPDGETFDGPASVQGDPVTTTTTTTNADGSTNTHLSESVPTYNFDYSTNPLTVTVTTTNVTNTYDNGTHTSTTTVTDPGNETPAEEQPTDCDLVPTLCKWSEWTKEEDMPDKEELPVEEVEKPSSVSVGPGAACPAPVQISVPKSDLTVEFSYQPTCDLLSMINPIVRGCGLLAACFILVWRRK